MVGFHADLINAVGDILLLRGLQAGRQSVIQNHPLLGVRLQLIDQNQLRGGLIGQTIDPSFTFFDITLQRLAFRQLHLLVLHQRIVTPVQSRQFSFQLGARTRVLLNRDLVFQFDDLRVHAANFGAHRFQRHHRRFTFRQRGAKVGLDRRFLAVQHIELALQQPHDDV